MNTLKRFGLSLFCVTVFLTACSEKESTVAKATDDPIRPNVIVVLADDMRANYTGFEGHPLIDTPNIDRLRHAGHIFLECLCDQRSVYAESHITAHRSLRKTAWR